MIPTKGFGLRNIKTRKLMGVSTRNCCCETQYILDLYGENPWIVEDALTAAWVRENSTEWYNAGYETPTNEYDPEELEVVEIELVVKPKKQTIPTWEEYVQRKYNNPKLKSYDPKEVAYVMSTEYYYSKTYSLYSLKDLVRDEEGRK